MNDNSLFGNSQLLNGIRGSYEGRRNTRNSPAPTSFRQGRGGETPVLHPDIGPLQRAVEDASHQYKGPVIKNPTRARQEPKNPRNVLTTGVDGLSYGPDRLNTIRRNFLNYMNGDKNG